MGKLIDSDIVKEYLKRAIFGADVKIDGWVDAMPAADAVPVVHGRWTHIYIKGKEYGKVYYQHENCAPLLFESPYHYCPHCGAKMDGEWRDENA